MNLKLLFYILILFIGFFHRTHLFSDEKIPIIYIKNNQYFLLNDKNNSICLSDSIIKEKGEYNEFLKIITDLYIYNFFVYKNNSIFFLENINTKNFCGDLSCFDSVSGRKKIDSNVTLGLHASRDGNNLLYIKSSDNRIGNGDLYLFTKNKGTKLICKNTILNNYRFSKNGQFFIFVEKKPQSDDLNLYLMNLNDNRKTFIDTGIVLPGYVSDDGNIVLYKTLKDFEKPEQLFDMYSWEKGKGNICISKYVKDYLINENNSNFYFISLKNENEKYGDLSYKEQGRKPLVIDKEVDNILKSNDNRFDRDSKNLTDSISEFAYTKNNSLVVWKKNTNIQVSNELITAKIEFTKDMNNFLYYKKDKYMTSLFIAKYSENTMSFVEEKISDLILMGAHNFNRKSNLIIFSKFPPNDADDKNSLIELYTRRPDGKNVIIAADRQPFRFLSNENGDKIIYGSEFKIRIGRTLYLKDNTNDPVKIDDKIYDLFSHDNKKIFYINNYNWDEHYGDLCILDEKYHPQKIDNKVEYILFTDMYIP